MRRLIVVVLLLATPAFAETCEGEFQGSRWPTFFTVHVEESGGAFVIRGGRTPITDVQRTAGTLRVSGGGITLDGNVEGDRWSGTLTAGKDVLPFSLTRVLLRKSGPTESWWDLSPRHADADRQWVHVLDGLQQLPLYLRDPNHYYWFEFLPDSGILYFHYNRSDDRRAPDETTKAFAERLLAQFEAHPVKAFVLDLRFNTGGDHGVAAELMRQLVEKTKGMPRYVLTGRTTFSAGMSHVATWRAQPDVTIVGEPVADDLDYWSEGGNIVLPNSGLYAHFANGAHSYSPAPCPTKDYCYDLSVPSLDPDVPVTGTWDEYRNGVDAMMEAVLRAVRRGKG